MCGHFNKVDPNIKTVGDHYIQDESVKYLYKVHGV